MQGGLAEEASDFQSEACFPAYTPYLREVIVTNLKQNH